MQSINTNRPHNFPSEPTNKNREATKSLLGRLPNVKLTKKQIMALSIGIVLLIASISQLERFTSEGTIFGYKVKDVSSQKEATSRRDNSGSLANGSVSKDNEKSIACDTFPIDKVSGLVGSDMERISGFIADKFDPILISSCIYRTKDDSDTKRTVSILLREQKNDDSAKKTFTALSNPKSGDKADGIGDQAYFNKNSNQLTVRKGKKLFTITASGGKSSKDENKNLAISVIKIVL